MQVIKKDLTKQDFDPIKIVFAITKSADRVGAKLSNEEVNKVVDLVWDKISVLDEVSVYNLHGVVESCLSEVSPQAGKSYREYRNYKVGTEHELMDDIERQVIDILESVDRENSNSNTRYISTKRTMIAQRMAKELFQKYHLSVEEVQAIRDGYIYVHDMSDMILPTFNCCLLDVKTVLTGGFELDGVWYNEPKDVRTAIGQVGDIIFVTSAQHYGGSTTPQIDKILAPYYKMTIEKYFEKNISRNMNEICAMNFAKIDAYNDMKQSLQGLEMKLNTVVSARGSYPFVTFTFGDCADEYEADVSKAILEVRMEGHGKEGFKKNLIFPKLVFIHNGDVHEKDKEFEWLFDLSIKCSSKNMYPDYIGQGHKREGKVVSPINS